jgi:hypothetical protein
MKKMMTSSEILSIRTFGNVRKWATLASILPSSPVLESVSVVNDFCTPYIVFDIFVEKVFKKKGS